MYEMLENKFSTFSDAMWWGWGSVFECFTLYSHNICVKFSWRNFPSNIWNISVYFLFEALPSFSFYLGDNICSVTEVSEQMLQLWLRDILYFRKASRFENVHYHLSMVGVYRKKIISINLFWVLRKSLSAQSCWKVEIESFDVCLRLIYFTCMENLSDWANWKPFSFSPSFQCYCVPFLFQRFFIQSNRLVLIKHKNNL